MTDKDAAIGRELMKDELETTNKYERMADHADDPKVAEVVRDVADEEKVHTGEGAAIVAANDPRAEPAMKEGVEEAGKMLGFRDMLDKAIRERDAGKGLPPMREYYILSGNHNLAGEVRNSLGPCSRPGPFLQPSEYSWKGVIS